MPSAMLSRGTVLALCIHRAGGKGSSDKFARFPEQEACGLSSSQLLQLMEGGGQGPATPARWVLPFQQVRGQASPPQAAQVAGTLFRGCMGVKRMDRPGPKLDGGVFAGGAGLGVPSPLLVLCPPGPPPPGPGLSSLQTCSTGWLCLCPGAGAFSPLWWLGLGREGMVAKATDYIRCGPSPQAEGSNSSLFHQPQPLRPALMYPVPTVCAGNCAERWGRRGDEPSSASRS